MNRNNKLKPLAPRPTIDQSMQHITSYAATSSSQAGSVVNRNAFAGANLGVHASPLEAVTSMDPRDYVWGGGYDASFQGYQQSVYSAAYGEPYCYPQAQPQVSAHGMHYGGFSFCSLLDCTCLTAHPSSHCGHNGHWYLDRSLT